MVGGVGNDQITITIELQSIRRGHGGFRHCDAKGSAGVPFLDSVVPRVHDVHITILIEGDGSWTTELVGPRTRVTCVTGDCDRNT